MALTLSFQNVRNVLCLIGWPVCLLKCKPTGSLLKGSWPRWMKGRERAEKKKWKVAKFGIYHSRQSVKPRQREPVTNLKRISSLSVSVRVGSNKHFLVKKDDKVKRSRVYPAQLFSHLATWSRDTPEQRWHPNHDLDTQQLSQQIPALQESSLWSPSTFGPSFNITQGISQRRPSHTTSSKCLTLFTCPPLLLIQLITALYSLA